MQDRLTGGNDECGLMGIRHFALILRMNYEEGSLKADGSWQRYYPITAHNLLEQVYYRGLGVSHLNYMCVCMSHVLVSIISLRTTCWSRCTIEDLG